MFEVTPLGGIYCNGTSQVITFDSQGANDANIFLYYW